MKQASRKALDAHRSRQKRKGFARVEVTVRKQDVPLIREVAKALNDPAQATRTRALIKSRLEKMDFKDFLTSAPLEGIDLTRLPDYGRDIAL